MLTCLRTSFSGLLSPAHVEVVLWEPESMTKSAFWFYCSSLEMVTHMLWGALSLVHQRGRWDFPGSPMVKVLIWNSLWELLSGTRVDSLRVSAGKWQVRQTFLQPIVRHSFQVSPSEGWCVKLHELITSALSCCSLLKILTPYWFPMAFQKGRTLLIHHLKNLW